MSLKDLFKQGNISKVLVAKSAEEIGKEAESERYVWSRKEERNRLIPQIDFSDPKNFAKFGSAEEYYVQSIKRIYSTYPYDGSRYEKQAWENSSSYLDLYIFEELYPRTTGHAIFSPDNAGNGWGTISNTIGQYDLSSDQEYIFFKGGPHPNRNSSKINEAFPSLETRQSGNVGANLFDLTEHRESNLKIGGIDGNTIEFWLKKPEFLTSVNTVDHETVFDCYTTSSITSSLNYGRLRVELSGTSVDNWGPAATATITISDYSDVSNTETLVLVDFEGTSITLTVDNTQDRSPGVANKIGIQDVTDDEKLAQAIALGLNASTTKITAAPTDGSSDTITFTQGSIGAVGNRVNSTTFGAGYGLLSDFTGGESTYTPFFVTCMSGNNGFWRVPVGNVTTSDVADGNWHHYSIVVENTGALSSRLEEFPPVDTEQLYGGGAQPDMKAMKISFYVDGRFNDSIVTGSTVDYVSGALVATVGSLVASPSGSPGGTIQAAVKEDMQTMRGYGKLSGSIDEFRFWKEARSARQVGLNWKSPIGAGTNLDLANTQLGVYYKFNEGITQTSSVDSTVIDYSGRVTNGYWTGYVEAARATGSAIVESSASAEEFKDPILYSFHPKVDSLEYHKKYEGRAYDLKNPGNFYRTFPEWILSEDSDTGENLLKLTQVMSSYFDTLYLQLKQLPSIKNVQYLSSSVGATGSYKPLPFMDRVLESQGFLTADMFADASIIEQYMDKDDYKNFTEKLSDVKNLIYQNIHNNLVNIYKTKGTENAFRNFIRCFGVDEDLIQLNIYSNNEEYEIKQNYRYRSERKNYIDFGTYGDHEAVVYQFKSGSQSSGFLSASKTAFSESGMSQTFECELIAPPPPNPTVQGASLYPYVTSSVFGVQQVNYLANGTVDEDDTSWELGRVQDDYANFQVYVVRPGVGSTTGKFVLTGSNASGITALSSSYYVDLYDDRKWNLGVRIVPKASPWMDTVSGSSPQGDEDGLGYRVEFYGVNYDANTIRDSFYKTADFSPEASSADANDARGDKFLQNGKRMYIGALRTNFTGAVVQRTDLKISSTRAWMGNISNEVINAHAIDASNIGTLRPYESAYLFENSASYAPHKLRPMSKTNQGSNQYVPNIATLALNWDFKTLTGSSGGGTFSVLDASSGSTADIGRYGWLGNILEMQHPGKGSFFRDSQINVVDTNYINSAKQMDPESINSLDMIKSLSRDDTHFTRESRPINYYFMLEKSMYRTITEQMLNYFGTIKDFNDLIGSPVYKYRHDYKPMEKLRHLFFEKVGNIPDLDKYIEYYRWLDSAIGDMAEQLYPASADHTQGLKTVVESHVLERNKYQYKYPSIERGRDYDKIGEGESQVRLADGQAMRETVGNWFTFGYPIKLNPLDLASSFNWWNARAERDKTPEITSGVTSVDELREVYRKIIYNPKTLALGAYNYRRGTKTNLNDIYNPPSAKSGPSRAYPHTLLTHGLTNGANSFRDSSSDLIKPDLQIEAGSVPDLRYNQSPDVQPSPLHDVDVNLDRFPKIKIEPKINILDEERGERNQIKTMEGLPSLYSSSLGLRFTNIQQDVSHGAEVPLQGPFVRKYVGGYESRNVPISTASQGPEDRVERFRISGPASNLVGGSATDVYIYPPTKTNAGVENLHLPRADINRGTRRPYNIRNIQQLTASALQTSTVLGNYEENYQIVMTSGRSINDPWFARNSGSIGSTTPEMPFLTGTLNYEIPTRTTTKSIIVERFSSPGGFEVQSLGYLDPQAEEKSVYNALPFKNRMVLNGSGSKDWTTTEDNDRTHLGIYTDIHSASGDGYNLLSSRHCGKFGIDSIYGTIRANDYDTVPSYQNVPRNTLHTIKYSNTAFSDALGEYDPLNYITASIYNNLFYNAPIPQSELQYAWISASLESASVHPLVGYTSNGRMFNGLVSGSNGFEDPIHFYKGEEASSYYSGYPADLVGLNTLVVDTILTASNLISASTTEDYRNTAFATVTDGQQFMVLMNHRNGGLQAPSWKLTFKSSNPLVRKQRENNLINVLEYKTLPKPYKGDTTTNLNLDNLNQIPQTKVVRQYIVPPPTSKFKPLTLTLVDKDSAGPEMIVKTTYSNNFDFMTTPEIDLKLGLSQTNQQQFDIIKNSGDLSICKLVYPETVYPKEQYTYLAKVRGRISYAEASGSTDFNRQLGTQRTFWRDTPKNRRRSSDHKAVNSQGILLYQGVGSASVDQYSGQLYNQFREYSCALSVWPLDAGYLSNSYGEDFANYWYDPAGGDTLALEPPQGAWYDEPNGELLTPTINQLLAAVSQEEFPSVDDDYDWRGPVTASQQLLYPNKWTSNLSESDGTVGSNRGYDQRYLTYNFYRADSQSGNRPWFDSYDEFASDIRVMAQGHTVLPEFRISEHMEYYIDNGFDFNNKFLTLAGADISASANTATSSYNEDFFKIYSHSDFMKHFATLDTVDNKLSRITLQCHGIKKLLPYNGFYPALRTTQLGSMFSQSFGPYISGSTASQTGSYDGERMKSILQPFFAPGIMYNTIKSGLAVDFPVYTGSIEGGSSYLGRFRRKSVAEGSFYNYRMPFEAIVEPQRYLPVDNPTDSTDAAISFLYNWTGSTGVNPPIFPEQIYGSWTGESDYNYNLAMNNFLAEVPKFFLKDGSFTTFSSKPENQFKTMKSGSTYYMDVVLAKTSKMIMAQGLGNVPLLEVTASTDSSKGLVGNDFHGQIFGPACEYFRTADNVPHPNYSPSQGAYYADTICMADPGFAPHTPPYFYGDAIARVSFTPENHVVLLEGESKFFTLDEILAGCKIDTIYTSSYTEKTNWLQFAINNNYPAGLSQMRLSSSVNLFGKSSIKKVTYQTDAQEEGKFVPAAAEDPTDSSFDLWTISPKFECPVINVSSSTASGSAYSTLKEASFGYQTGDSDDISNKQSQFGDITSVKSVWGQYGNPPSGSEGIFLKIKESYPDVLEDPSSGAQTTGSLIDICGFQESTKRVGEFSAEKTISEAVVAIPFVQKAGKRKFFPVLKTQVKYVLGTATKGETTKLTNNGKLPGESITNMVTALQKYVLPPHLDFINNKSVQPYVAYVFEFEHKLNRDDLSNIWQNLMPKIAKTAEEQTVMLSHSMDKNEFFGGCSIPPETQWMIFKIKRRAAFNYFAATADSTDDDRFAFQFEVGGEKKVPDYSYNWPYDYFSLVELAKIDAEAEFDFPHCVPPTTQTQPTTPEDDDNTTPDVPPPPPTPPSIPIPNSPL